jgi:hypothetical protein
MVSRPQTGPGAEPPLPRMKRRTNRWRIDSTLPEMQTRQGVNVRSTIELPSWISIVEAESEL